jgi:hypothetical protein
MKPRDPELEPELEALLAHRPIDRRVPPEVRARALARARAVVAAGGVLPVASPAPGPAPAISAPRGRRRFRIALAASLAIACSAVGAVAALHGRRVQAPPETLPKSAPPMPSAPVTMVGPAPAALAPPAEPSAAPSRSARSTTREDPFTAELELLQRAHAAYTRRDFSVALTLVGEHARRYPKGHLAEQREALRVRSLAGAGRTDEAHRAAAAFALQFPRSVLLSRMGPGSDSAGP